MCKAPVWQCIFYLQTKEVCRRTVRRPGGCGEKKRERGERNASAPIDTSQAHTRHTPGLPWIKRALDLHMFYGEALGY